MVQSVDFVSPITERLSSPFLLLSTGKREGNTSNTLNLQVHLSHLQVYMYKGHMGWFFFFQNEIGDSNTVSELGLRENP